MWNSPSITSIKASTSSAGVDQNALRSAWKKIPFLRSTDSCEIFGYFTTTFQSKMGLWLTYEAVSEVLVKEH